MARADLNIKTTADTSQARKSFISLEEVVDKMRQKNKEAIFGIASGFSPMGVALNFLKNSGYKAFSATVHARKPTAP